MRKQPKTKLAGAIFAATLSLAPATANPAPPVILLCKLTATVHTGAGKAARATTIHQTTIIRISASAVDKWVSVPGKWDTRCSDHTSLDYGPIRAKCAISRDVATYTLTGSGHSLLNLTAKVSMKEQTFASTSRAATDPPIRVATAGTCSRTADPSLSH